MKSTRVTTDIKNPQNQDQDQILNTDQDQTHTLHPRVLTVIETEEVETVINEVKVEIKMGVVVTVLEVNIYVIR